MVQLFQRYIPSTTILDFFVQSLLCLSAFGLAIQAVWWMGIDPTLPAMPGLRTGRALGTVSVLVLVFYLTGYFERRYHLNSSLYLPRLLEALTLSAITLVALDQLAPALAVGAEAGTAGLLLMSVLMVGWHAAAPTVLHYSGLGENVLILGNGGVAATIAETLATSLPWGYRLIGCVPIDDVAASTAETPQSSLNFGDSRLAAGSEALVEPGSSTRASLFPDPAGGVRAVGRIEDLEQILLDHSVQTLVVALNDRRGKLPLSHLIRAKLRGVRVYDATDFYERLTGRMLVDRLRPSSIIFSPGFAPSRATRVAKRALDAVMAALLLLLLAPLMSVVALAIRLSSPGPVLFSQDRVGYGGVPFRMFKFRTMTVDAENNGPQWASRNDNRVTPIGRLLRRSRIDELPQIFNVLVSQMSFVGPRPERPCFVRELRRQIPYYDQRHVVRPGITGWAQVKFPYGASVADGRDKLEYDLYYIKHLAVAFDLTIMLETIRVLLTAKGSR